MEDILELSVAVKLVIISCVAQINHILKCAFHASLESALDKGTNPVLTILIKRKSLDMQNMLGFELYRMAKPTLSFKNDDLEKKEHRKVKR